MFDLEKDYSYFHYPIWTQQQNGMLLISSQDDFKACFKYIPLPPKKKTKESIKKYAMVYFNGIAEVEEMIQKELKRLKKLRLPFPEPKSVKSSLKLKSKKFTPPLISELTQDGPKPLSVQTVRRMFDRGEIENKSKSKSHRWTTIDCLDGVVEFI